MIHKIISDGIKTIEMNINLSLGTNDAIINYADGRSIPVHLPFINGTNIITYGNNFYHLFLYIIIYKY